MEQVRRLDRPEVRQFQTVLLVRHAEGGPNRCGGATRIRPNRATMSFYECYTHGPESLVSFGRERQGQGGGWKALNESWEERWMLITVCVVVR